MFLSGSGCALRGWAEGPARKPGGSKNRKSTTNSSAQRGAKTDYGFRARRTVAAQSTAQFSAPCQPHCGSAVAPPRLPSPAAILAGLAECQPAEYTLLNGRATEFCSKSRFFARLRDSTISAHCRND